MMFNTEIEKIDGKLVKNNMVAAIKKQPCVRLAKNLLEQGELVAFPTETVYGLGADAASSAAVKKIFEVKGRPQDNPLIVHIGNKNQLADIVKGDISPEAQLLIDEFWPGPLTLIFTKKKLISSRTTAGLKTVAVRMPSHPVAKAILELSSLPVAAPSANSSGYPSPTLAEHVYHDLKGKIPLIIDGGACEVGLESTVLNLRADPPVILRPGVITARAISGVIGRSLEIDDSYKEEDNNSSPLSPGMKYRHYSPATPLYLINHEKINNNYLKKHNGSRAALVVTEETYIKIEKLRKDLKDFNEELSGKKIISMGSRKNLNKVAHNIFAILRKLDNGDYDIIMVEKVPDEGIGTAIMNRLYKAAVTGGVGS